MSEQPETPRKIDSLAAAVVSTAKGAKGTWLFAGWAEDGRPASADDVAGLAKPAHRAFVIYRESGLWPRQIRYRSIKAAEYVLTGPAVDFADHGKRRAQDHLQYIIMDEAGERRDLALGELALLEAIVSAREPWQSVKEGSGAEIARSAVALYTLFTPDPARTPDVGLAVLFRPTLPGQGNEPAFRAFVRQSLGRLLVLDESQPVDMSKGYLEAAAEHAGLPPEGGPAGLLHKLREIGFVEFDDKWLRAVARRSARARAGVIRLLRAVGAVDVSDRALQEIATPRPNYNIDALEVAQLVDLAEAMYWAAHKSLQ